MTEDGGKSDGIQFRSGGLHDFVRNFDMQDSHMSDASTPDSGLKTFTPMFQGASDRDGDLEMHDDDFAYDDYSQRPTLGSQFKSMTFEMPKPVLFTKPTLEPVSEKQDVPNSNCDLSSDNDQDLDHKISFAETESMTKSAEDIKASRSNAFKGQKYGIGAAMLKKMGYVEGKGLGKDNQGILEPIKQELRKQGSGIGTHSAVSKSQNKKFNGESTEALSETENDSSDEEYYKGVPKKTLYQLIKEIESLGFDVPYNIKECSNKDVSQKSFIEIRREGHENLEELKLQLNELNNTSIEVVSMSKLLGEEHKALSANLSNAETKIEILQRLETILMDIQIVLKDSTLSEDLKFEKLSNSLTSLQLMDLSSTSNFDTQRLAVILISPLIDELFSVWDPKNISDLSVLDQILKWNNLIPKRQELDDELDYWQSLLYSRWYPKLLETLADWPVDQPNVLITLLLDWNDLLDDSIINFFSDNVIVPKILEAISKWDPTINSKNSPNIWIFEWMPYLKNSRDIVAGKFLEKYNSIFDSWNFSINSKIFGLNSLKEIVGDERFDGMIQRKVVPSLVKSLEIYDYSFDNPNVLVLDSLFEWAEFIKHQTFISILNLGFFNFWFKALYEVLRSQIEFKSISAGLEIWLANLKIYVPKFPIIIDQIRSVLEMINDMVDNNSLKPIHQFGLDSGKIIDIISKQESNNVSGTAVEGIPSHKLQITFKEVVEDYCSANDLFVVSLKNNFSEGQSLFKVSEDSRGKNGLLAYISGDVLWIKTGQEFEPISLDSLKYRVLKNK